MQLEEKEKEGIEKIIYRDAKCLVSISYNEYVVDLAAVPALVDAFGTAIQVQHSYKDHKMYYYKHTSPVDITFRILENNFEIFETDPTTEKKEEEQEEEEK